MNELTQHRAAGYLRIGLVLVGILALGVGTGLWIAGRLLVSGGCATTWVAPTTPCQRTLLILNRQWVAFFGGGVVALVAAGIMQYLHRRALRSDSTTGGEQA